MHDWLYARTSLCCKCLTTFGSTCCHLFSGHSPNGQDMEGLSAVMRQGLWKWLDLSSISNLFHKLSRISKCVWLFEENGLPDKHSVIFWNEQMKTTKCDLINTCVSTLPSPSLLCPQASWGCFSHYTQELRDLLSWAESRLPLLWPLLCQPQANRDSLQKNRRAAMRYFLWNFEAELKISDIQWKHTCFQCSNAI